MKTYPHYYISRFLLSVAEIIDMVAYF